MLTHTHTRRMQVSFSWELVRNSSLRASNILAFFSFILCSVTHLFSVTHFSHWIRRFIVRFPFAKTIRSHNFFHSILHLFRTLSVVDSIVLFCHNFFFSAWLQLWKCAFLRECIVSACTILFSSKILTRLYTRKKSYEERKKVRRVSARMEKKNFAQTL